jgi:hypothetical protein
MNWDTKIIFSEQERKFIRLMLDAGAQGSEIYTSCEMLVKSLRKRKVTSEAFLDNSVNHQLKQALLEQTLRANKIQAELQELQIQHTRQLEYLKLKQTQLEQTLRANKIQAELHELQMQHTRQLEYMTALKPAVAIGRVHRTTQASGTVGICQNPVS